MKARSLGIFSHLDDGVDAVVLMNSTEPAIDPSFFYATGIQSGLFEGCAAILFPNGKIELLTSMLEETTARHSSAEIKVFDKMSERDRMIRESLQGSKRIGINGANITYRDAVLIKEVVAGAELLDVSKAIESARMIKDEAELEAMRAAGRMASKVANEIPSFLHEGMSETEASAEINYRMQKAGASSPAFDTIAAFGKNAAEAHYSPAGSRLGKGETALFDFGARSSRYCSDITRTFFLGHAPEKFRKAYQTVLDAQMAALDMVRAGVSGREVDAAARGMIDSSEFKGGLTHSVGHGVGLSVHDGGKLSPSSDLILKENMVLTVEPGIYIPGQGGVRIEDDVRVTAKGYELLTTAKKGLTVV